MRTGRASNIVRKVPNKNKWTLLKCYFRTEGSSGQVQFYFYLARGDGLKYTEVVLGTFPRGGGGSIFKADTTS